MPNTAGGNRLVNRHTSLLHCLLLSASPTLRAFAASDPEWVSPLEQENYREYQDGAFLRRLGLEGLAPQLAAFWPEGGPVWDGLARVQGKNGGTGVILVETKSHAGELPGPGTRASPASRQRIVSSLDMVKGALGVPATADWAGSPYYQYANRLAHLYFLSEMVHVPTWLVFLYVVNDLEQAGPATVSGWEPVLLEVTTALQLPPKHPLDHRMVSLFAPAPTG